MTVAASALSVPTLAAGMGWLSLHLAGSLARSFADLRRGLAGRGIPLSRMAASGVRFHESQGSGAHARAGR